MERDDESILRTAGAKGGAERARRLSPERKAEIASIGAMVRWSKEGKSPLPMAKYGAADRPLRIGDIEIPCYVLADGRRVLSTRGLQSGIGLSESGGSSVGAQRMAVLMASLERKGLDIKGLAARIESPIRFLTPHGGAAVLGHEATILPDICAVLIEAGRLGKLHRQQEKVVERCAILQHGFATVGIIALVDEATGYQDFRARDALALILERFVAKELRPWVKTFPAEFYQEIFRLNKWAYAENCGRPGVLGHWTNNIIYKRLAPGVLAELKRRIPRTDSGVPRHKLFQLLTEDVGHPKLREHLAGVVMLMKYSPNWQIFMKRLDKEYPQYGKTMMLPFPDDYSPPEI